MLEINKIYNCDNLDLLGIIPNDYIDLIYCDILYGTGKDFGDYKDLVSERKIIEEHYIPRILEMKRVLKDTGSIFLQMDCTINHWIRCIMDDIFGYNNFRNEIIWCYEKSRPAKFKFKECHDNIYFYSKSNKYNFKIQYMKSRDPIRSSKWISKTYSGKICTDWWDDIPSFSTNMNAEERLGYITQKPEKILERIIETSTNENDIVADFYVGSGTTCSVAKRLNRRYLGCDLNPEAVKITNERLKESHINISDSYF
jgi:site-specific DNA-methyltransferase (adenine-specific)